VTDMTLNTPYRADREYTIGDPAETLSFTNFASIAPACPYGIQIVYNNLPAFIVQSGN
jgi:hypothetical protein